MKPQIKIVTVIVNYKAQERTVKFVREEMPKCSLSQRIIIVNNCAAELSTNELVRELNAELVTDIKADVNRDASIYVIHNLNDSGFAKGSNLGFDFSVEHFDAEYVLFSNNDIVMQSDSAIEKMINRIKELPDVGVIGPKVIGLDGNCQSPNKFVPFWDEMFFIPWGRFIPFYKQTVFNQNEANEGYYYRVMGSFFLASTKDYLMSGKMDSNTYLYAEEVILAERMLAINKKFYYYPTVQVLHEHGYSINKNGMPKDANDPLFQSLSYYYKTYLHVSSVSIFLATISQTIYRTLQNLYRRK